MRTRRYLLKLVRMVGGVALVGNSSSLLGAQSSAPTLLRDAKAVDVGITRVVTLEDSLCLPCSPEFSPDDRRLLAVVHRDRRYPRALSVLRVFDVASAREIRALPLDREVDRAVWSNDQRKALLFARGNDVAILDLTTGEQTRLGEVDLLGERMVWVDSSAVYSFYTRSGGVTAARVFDFTTLRSRELALVDAQAKALEDSIMHHGTTPRSFVAELSSPLGRSSFQVRAIDTSFTHVFPSLIGSSVVRSPSNEVVALALNFAGEFSLKLVTLSVVPRTGTEIFATLVTDAPLTPAPSDTSAMKRMLRAGQLVGGFVRMPKLNPLNGRVVGSTGDSRAAVEILQFEGTRMMARIAVVSGKVAPGDLLIKLWPQTPDWRSSTRRMSGGEPPGGIRLFDVTGRIDSIVPRRAEPNQHESVPTTAQTGSMSHPASTPSSLTFEQLLKEASDGNAQAQARAGIALATGDGVPVNPTAAIRWLERAATGGSSSGASAACWLGIIHERGMGVPKSADEALRWYERGAELGNGACAQNLGEMYFAGTLVGRDLARRDAWYARAAVLYERQAVTGDMDAAYQLGRILHAGLGVRRDDGKAAKFLEMAANSGNANAADLLKRMRSAIR